MFDNYLLVLSHKKSIFSSHLNQRVTPLTETNDMVDILLITNSETAGQNSECRDQREKAVGLGTQKKLPFLCSQVIGSMNFKDSIEGSHSTQHYC